MTTKKTIIVAFLMAGISVGFSADKLEAQLTFKVTDENSAPLRKIPLHVVTLDRLERGDGFGNSIYKETNVVTDTNGLAKVSWTSADGQISYNVKNLTNYYDGGGLYLFKSSSALQWQPGNPTIELVLRPIVSPTPMYARKVEVYIPKPTRKYGYDLMVGDWVAPTGKGQTLDLIFEVTGYAKDVKDNDSTLTISFANPLDGIQPFATVEGSSFRSPREAPVDGYQDKLQLRKVRKPGQWSADWIDDTKGNTNYFFRVRTISDESGKIKNALYGKIYGGIKFGGAVENCYLEIKTYYLNPEPNSRNMEFNPKRNFFKSLKDSEQVSEP